MNFPDHRYLGPGNPVSNGPPVDEDDRIALQHDLRYHRAHSDNDIREADLKAIRDFSVDFRLNYNWHSAVGALGLGIKYGVESLTGVIYPFKYNDGDDGELPSSGVQPGPGTLDMSANGEQPAAKRQRTEEEAKQSSGGHGTTIDQINRPVSNFKTGSVVFTHSRIMFSYGYQFRTLTAEEKSESSGRQYLIATPFARVPCHAIPWYMTKSEFNNLPVGSVGKRFFTTVRAIGFRTPFVTNSASISNVNSNLLVLGVHAHGLNNKYHGTNKTPFSAATDPMLITSTKTPADDGCNIKDLWGVTQHANENSIAFDNIPACFGTFTYFINTT